MDTKEHKDCAIFTICTTSYLIGTEILLYSFLRQNRTFKGKIFVLLEKPDQEIVHRLKIFPNIEFLHPSPPLIEKLESLAKLDPAMKPHLLYFYCFEMFKLEGFERIIYLDSDILCKKDISELFTDQIEFGACGDRAYYDPELARSVESFKMVNLGDVDNQQLFDFPFNAGVLVVGRKLLNGKVYNDLLELIRPSVFVNRWKRYADQIVLNLYFDQKVRHLSAKFNFNTTLQESWIMTKDSVGSKDAALIHYAGRKKPWHILSLDSAEPFYLSEEWLREYRRYLLYRTFRQREFNSLLKWFRTTVLHFQLMIKPDSEDRHRA